VPLFRRTLIFELPENLVLTNEKRSGTNVLIEYLPRGETFANWTHMVTIQASKGFSGSVLSSAEIARKAFYPSVCKNGPIYVDMGEAFFSSELKRSIIVNGCASLPSGAYPDALSGAGEQDFIMMFRDADAIYALNYAFRGKSFKAGRPPVTLKNAEKLLHATFGDIAL
jgi:hypothetical protein